MVQQHMNLQQTLDNIKQQYEVLAVFDLNQWFDQPKNTAELWLSDQLKLLWKPGTIIINDWCLLLPLVIITKMHLQKLG